MSSPARPAPFVADDCPAWAFDASLSVPAHLGRIDPPAAPGPAARPTPSKPAPVPTLLEALD
jgi:hypothetical protein